MVRTPRLHLSKLKSIAVLSDSCAGISHAAAKSCQSVRRIVRFTGARIAVRQSRRALSYRCTNTDGAALGIAAMDLLRARFQEPPPRRLGPLLHRAVLSRRADGARRRSPAVFRVPPQRCRGLRRSVAQGEAASRAALCRRDGHRYCTTSGSTAAPNGCIGARSTRCPTALSLRWTAKPFAIRGDALLRWTPEGYDARKTAAARRARSTCSRRRRSLRCCQPATGRTGIRVRKC